VAPRKTDRPHAPRIAALGFGLTLLATLALALAPSGGAPPSASPTKAKAETRGKGKVVVPFELLASDHIVVRARVNGEGPYRMIFDLGAPITLLSTRAAEASGVVKKGTARPFLFGARGEERAEAMALGDLNATGVPVVVFDHPTLRLLGALLGRRLDGIIGFTFYARYRTTIDYAARELTFEPVDFAQPDLLKDLAARLAGPKVARRRVLAPGALFGITPGEPAEGGAGMTVAAVAGGSPAAAAGIRPGDLLTSLNGRWTTSVADVYASSSSDTPGQPVEAVVVRDGKEHTLTVTPREGF
jgi:membrane-associated protease RseP (regulator of RpoE activity)